MNAVPLGRMVITALIISELIKPVEVQGSIAGILSFAFTSLVRFQCQ